MLILYFTALIMRGVKVLIRVIYATSQKQKDQSVRTAVKEINNMKNPGTVKKCLAQNWPRCFKEITPNQGKRGLLLWKMTPMPEMTGQRTSTSTRAL